MLDSQTPSRDMRDHSAAYWRNVANALALFLLFAAFLISPTVTSADARFTLTPLGDDAMPPNLPTPEAVSPDSGEPSALYELAEELDWPSTVWRDHSGRLYVEQMTNSRVWLRAIIRPFDFGAGAEAAFAAEQEDARIAGYRVASTSFEGYAAYWAQLSDDQGRIIERRLHWLADRWILGAESGGLAYSEADVEEIAVQHVSIASRHGVPPRPPQASQTPTANPTRTSGVPVPTSTASPPTPTTGAAATVTTCPSFSDVPTNYWAYGYIQDLACSGIISGYSDGTFRPQGQVTRGQLVKMVVLSEDFPIVDPSVQAFSDVAPGHTFYRYIETASARGIISGYSNGTFRPDNYVSRAQIAKIVVRAKRWPIIRPLSPPACDVSSDHWAADYIYTAMLRGVLSGYADGCFSPDAYATRAQIAKVLSTARR